MLTQGPLSAYTRLAYNAVRWRALPIAPGTRVDGYFVDAELGRGGMGRVYAARDETLGREVALKFIEVRSRDAVERLLREARTTARCAHPNIVTIFGAGEFGGLPYLALERLSGHNLKVELQKGAIEWKRAVQLVTQVARALEKAHAEGIVHRDLKPDNIFLCTDGTVKVLDFGIAKFYEAADAAPANDITGDGQLVGSLPYMAPEQWRDEAPTPQTDLWAVGILLWSTLADRHPLESSTLQSLYNSVASEETDELPSFASSGVTVPTDLARLIDSCLVKRRAKRIPSASVLLERLETVSRQRSGRASLGVSSVQREIEMPAELDSTDGALALAQLAPLPRTAHASGLAADVQPPSLRTLVDRRSADTNAARAASSALVGHSRRPGWNCIGTGWGRLPFLLAKTRGAAQRKRISPPAACSFA